MHGNDSSDHSTSEVSLLADGLVAVASRRGAGHWLRLVFILMGGLVALPAFVVGAQFAGALGFRNTIFASFGGGLILAAVAAPSAVAGARTRLSSYALILKAFGEAGGKLVNVLMSTILIGWFGVIAMMFGHALIQLVPTGPGAGFWAVAGVSVTTVTAIVGFKALDVLALITLPFKIGLLVWAVFASTKMFSVTNLWMVPDHPLFGVGTGASLLAGGVITGALLVPDVCRFARTPVHAAVACVIAYGFGLPAVMILAAAPAQLTGQQDLIAIMVRLGLGVPAMLIVILAAWTNNTYNLYSTTLVYSTLAPRQPHWVLSVLGGIVGAALALAGIADLLTPYLTILSICVPPVAGVFLMHLYTSSRHAAAAWRWQAFAAWFIGTGLAGLEEYFRQGLTGVTAIDALLSSAAAYFILDKLTSVTRSGENVASSIR